jgi:small subunit ribosomal protein S16
MAVKIRLARAGTKKSPFYRIVAADGRCPRDGRFLEKLGTYDPRRQPEVVQIRKDRVTYWLGVGAQPSETVSQLLERHLGKA